MTLEVIVIAAVRIVGSLPVLRWAFLGGLLAILIDLSDLLLVEIRSGRSAAPGCSTTSARSMRSTRSGGD